MQLLITFSKDSFTVPVSYRHLIQGMIYHCLETDMPYNRALHDMTVKPGEKMLKGFTFGPFSGAYTVAGKQITFHSGSMLEIRSRDDYFIRTLYQNISAADTIQFGNAVLSIADIRILDRHLKGQAETDIRMRSPLVAYQTMKDGHTRFFTPQEDDFFSAVVQNAERKWQQWGNGEPFALQISRIEQCQYKKVFDVFKQSYITGYLGTFHLSGSPALLEMLYQTGLGVKNSEGFGMFDPV